MTIAPIGSYHSYPGYQPAPVGGATPVAQPYQPDAWAPLPQQPASYPGYGQPAGYPGYGQPAATGPNIGRYAAWGLGALGAFRFVLPHVATGWLKAVFLLGGALVGHMAWKKLEDDVPADKAGGVGHVGTIAGGALGAFLLGRSILGDNPAGWLLGGIVAGGAWIGHKLYAMVQQR